VVVPGYNGRWLHLTAYQGQ